MADLAAPKVLHARLVALHAFSEQLCPMLAMFPCQSRSTSAAGSNSHGAGGEEYGLDKLVFEIYFDLTFILLNL